MLGLPKSSRGDTYIGIIIAIGLFVILSQAILTLVFSAYKLIGFTRARTTAKHLAAERIEEARNLPFDDVGTVGGIPPGVLAQDEDVVKNSLSYRVLTSVIYVDDPFDEQAPVDLLPTDYKKVRVDVSWGGIGASGANTVTLISDVAPKGVETTAGGGTLSILVINANAVPVEQADVHIFSDAVIPTVDLNLQTDDGGRIILPGTPICDTCYEITVTKEGYTTERTYSTTEIANPDKPHVTVLEAELQEITFAIDRTSTVNVTTHNDKENDFSPLANQTFHVRGMNKILGTDAMDLPVYKNDFDITTDGSGTFTWEDVEWDSYEVTLNDPVTQDIVGTNPLIPLAILPNEVSDFKIALTNQSTNSFLGVFLDDSLNLVASVSAKLTGLEEFVATSGGEVDPDWGQVYFPDLDAATYTLEATASGFVDYLGTVDVSGYTREEVQLENE